MRAQIALGPAEKAAGQLLLEHRNAFAQYR